MSGENLIQIALITSKVLLTVITVPTSLFLLAMSFAHFQASCVRSEFGQTIRARQSLWYSIKTFVFGVCGLYGVYYIWWGL